MFLFTDQITEDSGLNLTTKRKQDITSIKDTEKEVSDTKQETNSPTMHETGNTTTLNREGITDVKPVNKLIGALSPHLGTGVTELTSQVTSKESAQTSKREAKIELALNVKEEGDSCLGSGGDGQPGEKKSENNKVDTGHNLSPQIPGEGEERVGSSDNNTRVGDSDTGMNSGGDVPCSTGNNKETCGEVSSEFNPKPSSVNNLSNGQHSHNDNNALNNNNGNNNELTDCVSGEVSQPTTTKQGDVNANNNSQAIDLSSSQVRYSANQTQAGDGDTTNEKGCSQVCKQVDNSSLPGREPIKSEESEMKGVGNDRGECCESGVLINREADGLVQHTESLSTQEQATSTTTPTTLIASGTKGQKEDCNKDKNTVGGSSDDISGTNHSINCCSLLSSETTAAVAAVLSKEQKQDTSAVSTHSEDSAGKNCHSSEQCIKNSIQEISVSTSSSGGDIVQKTDNNIIIEKKPDLTAGNQQLNSCHKDSSSAMPVLLDNGGRTPNIGHTLSDLACAATAELTKLELEADSSAAAMCVDSPPTPTGGDRKNCRFCGLEFESAIPLHQHER